MALMMRGVVVAALLLAACGKQTGPNALKLDQALKGLSSAGFKADGLQQTGPGPFSALRCVTGALEEIQAVVCEYGSVEAVGAGKKAAEAWTGQADTGVVLDNGLTILVLADRGRKDPNGKLLNRIAEAYQKLR